MFTKFVRWLTALLVIASIIGNTGVAYADRGAAEPQSQHQATSSPGVQFIQVATVANISGNATIIDHPLTNNIPTAIIIVTPNYSPGNVCGCILDDHPIGVVYAGGKWKIFNEDNVAMAAGYTFNVLIPNAAAGVFVHTATAGNSSAATTSLNHVLTNGNPNAVIMVTPNYDAGGVCGCIFNNHPIGVYYDGIGWEIFNQDGAAMPVNAAFNVFVLTPGPGVSVHQATAGNSSGNYTKIDHAFTNGQPNALVFVTPNYNPGGIGATFNNHNIGVLYVSNKWAIFNQDVSAIPANAAFNVLVLAPSSDFFAHKATAGNSSGNYTKIDKALTNSYPNALVFITPNWNPGGTGGTNNNHHTGVYYNGNLTNKWAIFNQDLATMPISAAFNVLVPNPDASVFVQKATTDNTSGNGTKIDYPLTNDDPNAIIFVTPNWNPGQLGGTYDDHSIGVNYASGKWFVYNQDAATMPIEAAFNVFVPTTGAFVHTVTADNRSGGNTTIIDNPRTNNNPYAIIIITSNYSPSGVCGCKLNEHAIGLYYVDGRWTIFNQDGLELRVGAAFNVYVVSHKVYLPLILKNH